MTQREKIAREAYSQCPGDFLRRVESWDGLSPSSRAPWLALADWILAERAKREGPLVETLRAIESCCMRSAGGGALRTILLHHASRALADHAALDAPPKRTLREEVVAMSDALKVGHTCTVDGTACVVVPRAAYNAVMNALDREDAK